MLRLFPPSQADPRPTSDAPAMVFGNVGQR